MRTATTLDLVAAGEIRSQMFMTSDQCIPGKNVFMKNCKMDAQTSDGKGSHSLW